MFTKKPKHIFHSLSGCIIYFFNHLAIDRHFTCLQCFTIALPKNQYLPIIQYMWLWIQKRKALYN